MVIIATPTMMPQDSPALKIAVLTVSDTRNLDTDKSGPLLVKRLCDAGHECFASAIVKDDLYQIRAMVSQWLIQDGLDVIITTGGTGFAARDVTPEAIAPLLDKRINGFGEMFRVLSFKTIATSSLQSRALAGVANRKYIFCLPGSRGACAQAWDELIRKQLDRETKPCNLAELLPRL